jgi:hypothetical protein
MTPKEINDLKRQHNAAMDEGVKLYARIRELHTVCNDLQMQIRDAEGDDYDPIPLIFGDGFWIDEDL